MWPIIIQLQNSELVWEANTFFLKICCTPCEKVIFASYITYLGDLATVIETKENAV